MMGRYALEVGLGWAAIALYIAATVGMGFTVVFGRTRALRWSLWLAAAGLVPHGVSLGIRWIAVGHGPYMLKYEVLSSNGWVAMACLVAVLAWRPAWSSLALAVMPIALLSTALGLTSNPEIRELPPTLRSMWLAFHVLFAKIAAAAFVVSLGASVMLLLRSRPRSPRWVERVPSSEALDALTIRAAGFGLLFWTMTIAAGAIWGNQSWGRYWGWDPIETWSLVAWLGYGSFLHARFFFKLRARSTAWFSIACFVVFLLALVILPFAVSSLHSAYFS